MELNRYLPILRRGWWIIAALTLVGAGVGWWSTPAGGDTPRTFYEATHTLFTTDREGVTRAAYLLVVDDVPERVAALLGQDPATLAHEVQVTSDSSLGTIEITTIQRDPVLAQQIVDAFASEFQADAAEQANAGLQSAIAAATLSADEIRASLDALSQQLAADPQNVALQAQREAERTRYEAAFAQLQGLLDRGTPDSGYRSFGPAVAVASANRSLEPPEEATRRGPVQAFRGADLQGNPPEPAEPGQPLPRSLAGGLIGMFIGIGLVLLLDRLDTRIRTARGAEAAFGAPVLGEVPVLSKRVRRRSPVIVFEQPRSAASDAYRRIRTLLGLMPTVGFDPPGPTAATNGDGNGERHGSSHGSPQWPVILVTSAGEKDGKSTAVANLAAAFAEGGERVLVFDCDLHRPSIHRLLQPRNVRSVASRLWRKGGQGPTGDSPSVQADPEPDATEDPISEASEPDATENPISEASEPDATENPISEASEPSLDDVATPSRIPNVWLVRATDDERAVRNPTYLLAQQRRLIKDARNHADVILLDTPPLLTANDANDLLPEADLVLLVARAGTTRGPTAARVSELLRLLRAPLVGVALLGSRGVPSSSYPAPAVDQQRTEEVTQPTDRKFTEVAPRRSTGGSRRRRTRSSAAGTASRL